MTVTRSITHGVMSRRLTIRRLRGGGRVSSFCLVCLTTVTSLFVVMTTMMSTRTRFQIDSSAVPAEERDVVNLPSNLIRSARSTSSAAVMEPPPATTSHPPSIKRKQQQQETSVNFNGRVIVMSVWTHYEELMRLQVESLRTFLQHDRFEYLAVLNSQVDDTMAALSAMAIHLGVHHVEVDDRRKVLGASLSHGHALNTGLSHLLDTNGTSESFDLNLKQGDILFLLDSDMFLTEPTNLMSELEGGHILSMPQQRGIVKYLWPNFALFHLPLEYHRELDFLPAVATVDGTQYALDSGGQTFAFLSNHHNDLNVSWVRNVQCTPASNPVCVFMDRQRRNGGIPDNCVTPELLEYAERESACSMMKGGSHEESLSLASCQNHARFYHLGSAGSNWRGCPEEYLRDRREDLIRFLEDSMQAYRRGKS